MNSKEDRLNPMLDKIKSWAYKNKLLLNQACGPGSVFSFHGKNGGKLITFYERSKYKGRIYAYIANGTFPGSLAQRDAFVNELKEINLYEKNMVASEVPDHRHLIKKLYELTDDEFEKFLNILGKYCF